MDSVKSKEPTIQDVISTKGIPDLSGYKVVEILLKKELPVLSNDFVVDYFSNCGDNSGQNNKSLEVNNEVETTGTH